ncbi:MAG: class I adenylate-forming enzyme family protein [Desulfobacteraceae bacterium]
MNSQKHHNIFDAFCATADTYPDHTAVVFLGTRYTYAWLRDAAYAFAAAMEEKGIAKGDPVMIYLPNSIQWIVSWLGIQGAGAVGVPITPIYTPHDLEYIANDSGATAIVCADTNFGYVQEVLPDTGLKRVVVAKMTDLLPAWKRWFGQLYDVVPKGKTAKDQSIFAIRQLLKEFRGRRPSGIDPDGGQTAEILYTGGTTKFPKGVPLNHDLFLSSAMENINISEHLMPIRENVILGNAPLFHVLGQMCSLSTLLVGGTLVVQPRINLDATFDTIQRFKIRSMIGVPALFRMMLDHVRLDQYDLSTVDYWFSAGDVLPEEVGRRWERKFGKKIYQGYGATETCGGVAMCPTNIDNPPKSVGRVLVIKSVRIIDPATLEAVPPGEKGELIVSSPHMVSAYLNKPEETAAAFIEMDGKLWYRTADIMRMDDDGNLYFVDRTVDTIKHKGYRVSASEIEAVLQEHPAVVATCVVGIPDEKVGERIKAYIVLKEDVKGITGVDLIKWCRKSLVAYKIPHYIEFRDMLPKSKVGKLLRREIRDEEKRRVEA